MFIEHPPTNMDYKVIVLILCSGIAITSSAVIEESSSNSNPRAIDAKSVLNSIAGSLMSRGYGPSAGGSQVVSLNLTNLLVLVLLKALIFAAGSLGAGTWKNGFGRSANEEKIFTEDEMLLFLSYLTGAPGDYGCLQNIACQQPEQAMKYVAAGDMLLKTAKIFSMNPDENYPYVLQEVEQAAKIGLNEGECGRYQCGSNDNR